jgi:hypothetical protein
VKIVMPGQPLRLPGSLANLEVALDAILLIERNDNHPNILGATAREIKLLRCSAPFCRELLRSVVPRHLPISAELNRGEIRTSIPIADQLVLPVER